MKKAILIVIVIAIFLIVFNFNIDFATSVIPGWHTSVNKINPILLFVSVVLLLYLLVKKIKK